MTLLLALALLQDPREDPEEAARRLQPAPGLRVALFAAEPDVTNPVGIDVDARGRVFLAETRRYNTSALYVKQHGHWYFDDLACRTVGDRAAVARKFLGADAARLEKDSEVVRLLEDTDGDRVADRSSVYADGFRTLLDGVASGVLVRGDTVWLANVPDLWMLRGRDSAVERRRLQHGYGVRFGNSGHDLHGLIFGPDGKLYFSMGDRGLHVEQDGRAVSLPDAGAVLRCNPDGSDLELFATGLRNPQGLAFDARGDLWTVDNNADMGDRARCLRIVEGGDYGWRVGYQYATDPWAAQELKAPHYLTISRETPWTTEGIWSGDAAFALPAAGYVSNGPCGLVYYPGTGLPAAYDDHFLLCDFPGGIHSFALRPKGASHELVDAQRFLWGGWPTDAKFGPDGALYVADWVYGFPMTGKGRVFRVFDPNAERDPAVAATRTLLAEGMDGRTIDERVALLGHRDLRVRQAAQFSLAVRDAAPALVRAASDGRVHAVWALAQIGARDAIAPLLGHADAEIRAQAAKAAGDLGLAAPLRKLLADPSPRTRSFAMAALGKAARRDALQDAAAFLREHGGDPWLRHAAVTALAASADPKAVAAAAEDGPTSLRLGVVLALRRLASPELARFLQDPDPSVAFEAARAINDVPVEAALPALAESGLGLRALSAAFRLGDAARVAGVASREGPLRQEALKALAAWGRPSGRERVTGRWRPVAPRDPAPAREALEGILEPLLASAPDDVRREAIRAAAELGVRRAAASIGAILESGAAGTVRVEALQALLRLDPAKGGAAIVRAAGDADPVVRREGVRLAPRLEPAVAVEVLSSAAEDAPLAIRQAALAALASVPGSDAVLSKFLDRLVAGGLPVALHLDVLEAGRARDSLRGRVATFESGRAPDARPELLEGGDAQAGRRIFFERSTVACLRCHKAEGTGGDVGPPLGAIGKDRKPEQLLESILYPNRQITQGYGQELVRTASETVEVGRVKSETDAHLVLVLADGRERRLPKSEITARKPGLSAMPDDVAKDLTRRDLRDLVAYLSGLRSP